MRLDKITRLTSDGGIVGCRFYPAVYRSEHLPPPTQVAVEIRLTTYGTPTATHNAFVSAAEQTGTHFQRFQVATANTGLCFQTDVWKPDHATDWACAFAKGKTAVVIRTVVTRSSLNVQLLAQAVYSRVKFGG